MRCAAALRLLHMDQQLSLPDAPFECTCAPDCWCGRMTSRRWKLLLRLEPLGRVFPWRPQHKLDPTRALDARRMSEWKRRRDPLRFQPAEPMLPAVIDVLYFEGCPNHEPALELVRGIAAETTPHPLVREIEIRDVADAQRRSFLGSPTIRVNGRDIEPGAGERNDFGMSCRRFATPSGASAIPEPEWITTALAGSGNVESADQHVSRALDAARIPTHRCGDHRASLLSENERVAYQELLRRMTTGERPTLDDMTHAAFASGAEPNELERHLRDADLIHFGSDRGVTAAYPFSGTPTRHEITIEGQGEAHAMCAIDALGVSAMLDANVSIRSTDPMTDDVVDVSVSRDRVEWKPSTAVVVVASAAGTSPSCSTCCSYVNFFAAPRHALEYLAAHPELDGYPVTIPVATLAGEHIFGQALSGA